MPNLCFELRWTHVFHVMKMEQHQKTISILDRPFLKRSLGFRFWVDLQLRRALYTEYPCNHPVNNPYLALCQGTSWPTCDPLVTHLSIQGLLHLSIFYHRRRRYRPGVPVPRQIQSRAGPLRGSRENRAGRGLLRWPETGSGKPMNQKKGVKKEVNHGKPLTPHQKKITGKKHVLEMRPSFRQTHLGWQLEFTQFKKTSFGGCSYAIPRRLEGSGWRWGGILAWIKFDKITNRRIRPSSLNKLLKHRELPSAASCFSLYLNLP
jgi:hypothetical protein